MNEAGAAMSGRASRRSGRFVRAQSESEAVAFEVANDLLDLHALSVHVLDAGAGAAVMRQRGGEQPRGSVRLSI